MNPPVNSNRYRFSRASRLLKPSEFQAVFDARQATRGQWLTAHRADTTSFEPDLVLSGSRNGRLGLVVAKRLVPTAARRNLIRRIVREYFRTHPEQFLSGDWIIRLHESPFPNPAKIRAGAVMPTRTHLVRGLREDLVRVLSRSARKKAIPTDTDHA